jgi:hypothetical protein
MHSILVRAALNAKRSTFNIADMSNIRDGALYLSVRKLNFKARLFAKKGLTETGSRRVREGFETLTVTALK